MKYVVKDSLNQLHVIEATGFTPEAAICQAPDNAESDDGPCIDLETDVDPITGFPYTIAKINAARKAAKEEAKAKAKADADAANEAKKSAKAARKAKFKALDWAKVTKIADVIPIVKDLVEEMSE